jgi:hypothetical protein
VSQHNCDEQGSLDRHFALNTDVMFLDVHVQIPRGPTLTLKSLQECNVVNHTFILSKVLFDGPTVSEAPIVFTSSTQHPTWLAWPDVCVQADGRGQSLRSGRRML